VFCTQSVVRALYWPYWLSIGQTHSSRPWWKIRCYFWNRTYCQVMFFFSKGQLVHASFQFVSIYQSIVSFKTNWLLPPNNGRQLSANSMTFYVSSLIKKFLSWRGNSLSNKWQTCLVHPNWYTVVLFCLKSSSLIVISVLSISLKLDFGNARMFVSQETFWLVLRFLKFLLSWRISSFSPSVKIFH